MSRSAGKLELDTMLWAKVLERELTQAIRSRDDAPDDATNLFFHRDPVLRSPDSQLLIDLVIELADAYACHLTLPAI